MVRISHHRIPTRKRRVGAALIHYAVRVAYLARRAVTLGFYRKRRFPDEVKKILIFRADGLGDVIMTLPAISALRDLYPHAEFTLLAGSPSRPLVPHLKDIDRVTFLDLPWTQRGVKRVDWKELGRVLRGIRDEEFDLIIDFRGDFRNILLMQRMGNACKVGFGWSGCGFLLDWEVPAGENRHEVEHKLDVARGIEARTGRSGVAGGAVRFDLVVDEKDWDSARQRFPELDRPSGGFVVLHPGAQWWGRQWTAVQYAEVADRIVRDLGLAVVVTGVSRERDLCTAVVERMKEAPLDLTGRLSFAEFLAVLARARLFLGVDSGPMHLAVALGVPVVALFGPGDPNAIGPYGPDHIVVSEAARFACSPCAQNTCPHEGASCMDAISSERVWDAVRGQVSGRRI